MNTIFAASGQEIVQQTINALSLGATYALLALGLAMVFSVLGLVNFAHGELVAIAAYTMYLTDKAGAPFVVQALAAVVAGALGALLMERIVFRPLRRAGFITLLISSFALSVLLQNVIRATISPRAKGLRLPDILNQSLHVGPYVIGWLQIFTLVVCALGLIVLTLFLRRSTQGLGMLAAAEDFQATRLMGIPANRVIAAAFAISGALAGLAAIFYVAQRGQVDPAMGFTPLLKAFIAVVIGGLGSLPGAVVGGFLLAAIEVALDAALPTSVQPFRDAFALGIVVLILYFRPEGLLTRVKEPR
jgi:branched-chain amino acid transport system permease protein